MPTGRSTEPKWRTSLATLTAYSRALDYHALITVTDLRGRITHANDLACRISGYERAELIGNDHRILNSGRHPKLFWSEMWATIVRGETWRGEVCNKAKDGSLYWVDTTIGPVRGADESIAGYISVRILVTDRKRAEKALAESEAKFRALAEGTGVILWEYDLSAHALSYVSPQAASLGYPLDRHFEPGFWESVVHPDDREQMMASRRALIQEQTDLRMQYRIVWADGSVHWLDDAVSVTVVGGKVTTLRGVIMDITESRQQREELARARDAAEAASRSKTEFLANMSHEIRTPMTAILGYADLLRDEGEVGRSSALRLEIIETISRAGQHLMSILDDILDLSKIEANKVATENIETPLAQLLVDVKSLVQQRAVEKGVTVNLRLEPALPERVLSDPTRLRQILINLSGNAVKFTESGSVTIAARAEDRDGQSRLIIDVEDTGRGLTPPEAERLFNAFAQADGTMTRKFGGTGLGLTISRRLARLMGGDLSLAWSEPGRGSCFRLDLPLEPVPGAGDPRRLEGERRPPTSAANPTPISLSGRILVAEDGADNRRLLAFHLEKAGARVDLAEDGVQALEMLIEAEIAGAPYDLLLSDMQMPEMDGFTLVRTLRGRGSTLAVVAVTAHALSEDREECMSAGCDDYTAKPIDRAALLEKCARWIGRKSAKALVPPSHMSK